MTVFYMISHCGSRAITAGIRWRVFRRSNGKPNAPFAASMMNCLFSVIYSRFNTKSRRLVALAQYTVIVVHKKSAFQLT